MRYVCHSGFESNRFPWKTSSAVLRFPGSVVALSNSPPRISPTVTGPSENHVFWTRFLRYF
jgi:hypothetical protein